MKKEKKVYNRPCITNTKEVDLTYYKINGIEYNKVLRQTIEGTK